MAGIAGQIGAGAREGLEEVLARVAREQAVAEAQRQAGVREGFERERLDLEGERVDLTRGREERAAAAETRGVERAETGQRALGNIAGLLDLGVDPDTLERESLGTTLRAGIDLPKGVAETIGERKTIEGLTRIQQDPETPSSLRRLIDLRRVGVPATPSAEMLLSDEERAAADERQVNIAGRIAGAQAGAAARFRAPTAPTQRFTPRTVTVNDEVKLANFDPATGQFHDVNTGNVLSDVGPPPTADMQNRAVGRDLVGRSIAPVEDLSRRIITKVGPAQRANAVKRGAEAVFGNDPEFRVYTDAKRALAGNLAVAQQGSRPSDADINAIWVPLVPDPYRDTRESMELKWEIIKLMSNVPVSAVPDDAASGGGDQGSGASRAQPRFRFNPQTGKVEPVK